MSSFGTGSRPTGGMSLKTGNAVGTGTASLPNIKWRYYIFPDYVIYQLFRKSLDSYLHKERSLVGFDIYIVEQWVQGRKPANVVASYTGNEKDIIYGMEVMLPDDFSMWPHQLNEYYLHVRKVCVLKDLDENTSIFVTELSQFPSSLRLLHVECGDVKEVWFNYKVNFNLKRLKCSGRSVLFLSEPPAASFGKFLELYKIAMVNTEQAKKSVVVLVMFAQITLSYFNLLGQNFKDGIFCEYTVQALDNWWLKYGTIYFGMSRPLNEGPLGPTTVVYLISLLLSCYFKLLALDLSTIKDPFDEESFIGALYQFQKKYGLEKTGYLDENTINKLFQVATKSSNADIFNFKKVVKSTVKDITGRRNPMQMSGVLNTDIDNLILYLKGSGSIKAFWRGKCDLDDFISRVDLTDTSYVDNKSAIGIAENRMETNIDAASSNGSSEHSREISFDREEATIKISNEEEASLQPKRRLDETALFQNELQRRASIPIIDSPGTILEEALNDDNMDLASVLHPRSLSFSFAEDLLLSWPMPFEPSVVRTARDILKVQKIATHKNGEDPARYDNPTVVNEFTQTSKVFDQLFADFSRREQTRNALVNRHDQLKSEMDELDTLTAKFKYDIKVLHTRLREIVKSISQFGSKLQMLEQHMKDNPSEMLLQMDIFKSVIEQEDEPNDNQRTADYGILLSFIIDIVAPVVKKDWTKLLQWFSH
ncbi:HDR139Cp [Eremothecium sinecaudum]|uniref:HDR139Cp n=1 Tax=Eremothecium sinecaudum TaxID=45286 RepID=A0A109UZ84_9SACH|nr:HDR139Cp [Eremothecium sinecaudum]AMD20881.1 HDR139Cp [Eremothecium sinecaudum]